MISTQLPTVKNRSLPLAQQIQQTRRHYRAHEEKPLLEPAVSVANDNSDKLLTLIPLIKLAWAEGGVDRKERNIVFEAAAHLGIEPNTAAHQQIEIWLESNVSVELYQNSLRRLSEPRSNEQK